MFDPSAVFYMDKLVVGPAAAEVVDIRLPVKENIRRLAKAKGIRSSDVTVMVLDRPRHQQMITEVREAGARVALDDFGTGFSTLARLSSTPVDTVKIDRFFVADIDHDVHQKRFLVGLFELTRHLGVRTVAEGVERPGQLRELQRLGCDLVQGHLIARPAPPEEFTPLLLSDAVAALDYDVAADVLDLLRLDVPDEDDADDDPWPEGDLSMLADLGVPADELAVLVEEIDLYPDEQLTAIARRCGFADELAKVVETAAP